MFLFNKMADSQLIVIVKRKNTLDVTFTEEMTDVDKTKIIKELAKMSTSYDINKICISLDRIKFPLTCTWLVNIGFTIVKTEFNWNNSAIQYFEIDAGRIINYYVKTFILTARL